MVILFVGGGTGGSVSPLLAVADQLKNTKSDLNFVWLGTKKGPEKKMVTSRGIFFYTIFSGKLRRYFSWRNFVDPFLIFVGFVQSIILLKKIKPAVVVSSGSFVSVPVGLAAWLLRIPLVIHQLDIKPGLANKILAWFATKITVSFEKSLNDLPKSKSVYTGSPVREEIFQGDKLKAEQLFNLDPQLPTILVVGGGTGALRMNQLIIGALPELLEFCQIIHITGRGKKISPLALKNKEGYYHPYEFVVNELPDMLVAADLVITRAGIGFLTELSALGKPAMIIPIPDSHQELNARFFSESGAAITLDQNKLSSQNLVTDIRELLTDYESLNFLSAKAKELYIPEAAFDIANQVLNLIRLDD